MGRLNEWNDIASTVGNIRKDFAHPDKKQHRKRRAEGGTEAGTLNPLIGEAVLDTRRAQGVSGIIDWGKVEVQDWTTATRNSINHARIREISKDFSDKEILYEPEHGSKDTSTCTSSVRISSHHSGATEFHERSRKCSTPTQKKGYYDGPYKAMPFVGGRALPIHGDLENDGDFRILGHWELNFGHFGGGGQDQICVACACKPS